MGKTIFKWSATSIVIGLVIVAIFAIYNNKIDGVDNGAIHETLETAPVVNREIHEKSKNTDIDTELEMPVSQERSGIAEVSQNDVLLSQQEFQVETKTSLGDLQLPDSADSHQDHISTPKTDIVSTGEYAEVHSTLEMSEDQINLFIAQTQVEYGNHEIPELRRFAEISPKIIRGEPLTREEMPSFLKATVILNPIADNKQQLSDFEQGKGMFENSHFYSE